MKRCRFYCILIWVSFFFLFFSRCLFESQIPDWLGGNLITRGTVQETPEHWHSGWFDGLQEREEGYGGSEDVYRGTISVGGVVPVEQHTHRVGDCGSVEMEFGDVAAEKYHTN